MNCITINTDASFHPIKKTSGYAFYIICDLFKITKAEQFKTEINNALEAEIKCIGNALSTLLAQKELPKTKLVVVNTDCQFAISSILRNNKKLNRRVRHIILLLGHKIGCKVEFRWVKAHSDIKDKRSYANEWCDKNAKIQMRANGKK